jgi:two-component system KDP operon response regulator KdpE
VGYRILIVDVGDSPDAALGTQLAQCGFAVHTATDLESALRLLGSGSFALAVVRVVDANTVDLRHTLPMIAAVPVVAVCTGRDPDLVVRCLEAGADTVLTAPISRRELAGRVHATLGWCNASLPPGVSRRPQPYQVGDLTVDPDKYVVTQGGRGIALTPTEFRLLVALARQAGETVCHADLLSEVWGTSYAKTRGNLRLYIRYLRRKLASHNGRSLVLLNHRGVGYRLAARAT